jgi:prolyl oligopeptidase
MFTAGENDSRVHPLHARKMAARMQAMQADAKDGNPVLLWVDRDAGHGQGKPLAARIRDQVDQWSFLMWRTGLCERFASGK